MNADQRVRLQIGELIVQVCALQDLLETEKTQHAETKARLAELESGKKK